MSECRCDVSNAYGSTTECPKRIFSADPTPCESRGLKNTYFMLFLERVFDSQAGCRAAIGIVQGITS